MLLAMRVVPLLVVQPCPLIMDDMNIDWKKVTLNLRTHYKPLSAIAKEIGSDWAHLNRLARGDTHQPRFGTGVKLLDLHYDKCKAQHNKGIYF